MKYSKELHNQLRKRDKDSDSIYVQCLLDEIERLQALSRWIPVSEGLPEQGVDVWIVEKHRHKKTDAQFFDGFFGCGDYELSPLEVVCWMYQVPLPEPPEDK